MVPACNPFIVMSHWNITPHAGTVVWYLARPHFSGNMQVLSLYDKHLKDKGPSTTNLKIFGLARPGIEPGTSQTQSECSTTRLPVLVYSGTIQLVWTEFSPWLFQHTNYDSHTCTYQESVNLRTIAFNNWTEDTCYIYNKIPSRQLNRHVIIAYKF